jgi:hypothetical protein
MYEAAFAAQTSRAIISKWHRLGAPTDVIKTEEQLVRAVGEAAVALWARLPRDLQQLLFEQVVATRGEQMRPELAKLLHDNHPRTSDAPRPYEFPEPDSLGG